MKYVFAVQRNEVIEMNNFTEHFHKLLAIYSSEEIANKELNKVIEKINKGTFYKYNDIPEVHKIVKDEILKLSEMQEICRKIIIEHYNKKGERYAKTYIFLKRIAVDEMIFNVGYNI